MVRYMYTGNSIVDSWILLIPLSIIHIILCMIKQDILATLWSVIDFAVLCTLTITRGISSEHYDFNTDRYIAGPLSLVYVLLWGMFYVLRVVNIFWLYCNLSQNQ